MSASPVDDFVEKIKSVESVSLAIETVKCLTKAIREPLQGTHLDEVWKHAENDIKTLSKELAKCLKESDLTDKPQ